MSSDSEEDNDSSVITAVSDDDGIDGHTGSTTTVYVHRGAPPPTQPPPRYTKTGLGSSSLREQTIGRRKRKRFAEPANKDDPPLISVSDYGPPIFNYDEGDEVEEYEHHRQSKKRQSVYTGFKASKSLATPDLYSVRGTQVYDDPNDQDEADGYKRPLRYYDPRSQQHHQQYPQEMAETFDGIIERVAPFVRADDKDWEKTQRFWMNLVYTANNLQANELYQFLCVVSSTSGMPIESLLIVPVDLLKSIDAFVGTLTDDEIEEAKQIMNQSASNGSSPFMPSISGLGHVPFPAPFSSMTQPTGSPGQIAAVNAAAAAAAASSSSSSSSGFPSSLSAPPPAPPPPSMDTDQVVRRMRESIVNNFKNQTGLLTLINKPEIHGNPDLIIKHPKLLGWELDAMTRLRGNPAAAHLKGCKIHHFYHDDDARTHMARFIGVLSGEGTARRGQVTLDRARNDCSSDIEDHINILSGCVWARDERTGLVYLKWEASRVHQVRKLIVSSAGQMPSNREISAMASSNGYSSHSRGVNPYAAQKAMNYSAGLPSGYAQSSSFRPTPGRGRRAGGVNLLTY